jgi:DNA-binding MarR family transcriptional regulator
LAQILAVSPAQISGLVERLCAAGLLQCLAAEGDRRLRLWRLMPAGQAIWRMLNDDSNPREEAA